VIGKEGERRTWMGRQVRVLSFHPTPYTPPWLVTCCLALSLIRIGKEERKT
jgi:hypothetical protein